MECSTAVSRRDWLSPSIFLLIYIFGVWPTAVGLFQRWLKLDESYSHGLLIFAVSVFLSIRKWLEIRPVTGFYWVWALPFVLSALLYLTGGVLLIEAFQELALLPMLMSGLMVLWGWRQSCSFFVPVGLLVFGLPLWDYLAWPLQLVTVEVNQFLLSFLDIEFYVEGVFVYFPGVGAFEVAHGCSGLRYWLVGFTISVLYGELNYRTLKSRVMLAALGILLALLANWIRVFVIIYLGYESNMTSSLIADHEMFGWWVFAGTLVPLFIFAKRLEKREHRAVLINRPATPGQIVDKERNDGIMGGVVVAILASGFTFSACSTSMASHQQAKQDPLTHEVSLLVESEWLPLFQRQLAGWEPKVISPDRRYVQSFASRTRMDRAGAPAEELLIGLYSYDYQRPGGEVVQFGNRLYDPSNFTLEQTFSLDTDEDGSLAGLTLKFRGTEDRVHIVYGYYVEGRWETNNLQAKLAQLPGILNKRSDASLLVVGMECSSCDGKQRLAEFAPNLKQAVQNYLDRLYALDSSQG